MKQIKSASLTKLEPYLFLLPAIGLLAMFLLYPIINVFFYSFQHYNPTAYYGNGFAGLDNYIKILTGKDPRFINALLVSFKWVFFEVLFQLICGLGVALLLNQKFKARGLARGLMFAPWALSGVIVSIIWSLIYNEHIGVLNDILIRLGILARPAAWLGLPETAFPAVIVVELWRGIPFFAISLLAALQSVPGELYESCAIDGGGAFRKFFSVTMAYLKDTIILTTLLRAVWEFNSVDLLMNLTDGGPMESTTTISVYLSKLAIRNQEFGYGSAVAIISFFILMIFAVLYLKASRFGEEDL